MLSANLGAVGRRAILATTLALTSLSANAVTLSFQCITNNSTSNCSLGESLLSVDVSSYGTNQALFRFNMATHTSSTAPNITEVYFDDGTLLGIATLIDDDDSSGLAVGNGTVDFTQGTANPPNLPGGNSILPAFQVTAGFLADVDTPQPQVKAVDPGEWLGVIFNLQSGGTYADILSELADGRLRIGVHITGYSPDGSESFVNDPYVVPVPAAVWLFGSGLIGLAGIARRRVE